MASFMQNEINVSYHFQGADMNRFVVAEPRGVQDVIPVSLPVRTCIKRKFTATPAPGPGEDVNNHCPCRCHHCEEAPCLQVCPVNAISRGMMRSNSTKASVLAASFAPGLPIWRNQRFRKPSGECPCAYVFQAEGSLKNGEENVLPQLRCCAGNLVSRPSR